MRILLFLISVTFFVAGLETARAVNNVVFSIEQIASDSWVLENAFLALDNVQQASAQFSLTSGQLSFPKPFRNLKLVEIRCADFDWRSDLISCRQGRGRLHSKQFRSPSFNFSFHVQDARGKLSIRNLKLWSGSIDVTIVEKNGYWRVWLNLNKLSLKQLAALKKIEQVNEVSGGRLSGKIELSGYVDSILSIQTDAKLNGVTLTALENQLMTEALGLQLNSIVKRKNKRWHWQVAGQVDHGDLFFDPVYLSAAQFPLRMQADGYFQSQEKQLQIQSAEILHDSISVLKLAGTIRDTELQTISGEWSAMDLAAAYQGYIKPFLEGGEWADIQLDGRLSAQFNVDKAAVELQLKGENIDVSDPRQRLAVEQAGMRFFWTNREDKAQSSWINWRQLVLQKLPFAAGRLDFQVFKQQFALLKAAKLSLLSGVLAVEQFSFKALENSDADVVFAATLDQLSLKQLTTLMGWPVLEGEISGSIPAVSYRNKKLDLDGEITMRVFDGQVTIKKLASSGLFTHFAQFYTDIAFDHLDLSAMTNTFEFGEIEGRLSGYVNDLYLENWRPVKFHAWIGTPEDDDSRHRISQKAVKNIASIGGGGAVDALSRSFLGMFETFGYDSLGVGCYLHQGVCQMMGVQAAENGYYLIKGGGLPRIDVIGYNPRLDWTVLMERLARITVTDEIVIE